MLLILKLSFTDGITVFASALALLMLLIATILPFLIIFLLFKFQKRLDETTFTESIIALYEHLDINRK